MQAEVQEGFPASAGMNRPRQDHVVEQDQRDATSSTCKAAENEYAVKRRYDDPK